MIFLESGYLEDGLKALVYLIPLVFLIAKGRNLNLKYFWFFFVGLFLLFFGHLLDFLDEFNALKGFFIIGRTDPLHDFFEDTIGFMLGFAVFILALYLEIKKNK
ncbi:MAG: hypothetical protein ISS92_01275 [Candidatus Omnitrophica bacterium]|nr:hypothetical protein [Candidatus Omnitrophota bacterium]